MLVIALTPHIGHHRAAYIARWAYRGGGTLKQAVVALGYVTDQEFDRCVQPENRVRPGATRRSRD